MSFRLVPNSYKKLEPSAISFRISCTASAYIPPSCPPSSPSGNQQVVVWRSGSTLVSINEVNLRRIRLVPRWVTVTGFNSRCKTFISVCNQPPMSTQPGHHFVGRRNWVGYQPKGSDALWPHSKGRYGSSVGGR